MVWRSGGGGGRWHGGGGGGVGGTGGQQRWWWVRVAVGSFVLVWLGLTCTFFFSLKFAPPDDEPSLLHPSRRPTNHDRPQAGQHQGEEENRRGTAFDSTDLPEWRPSDDWCGDGDGFLNVVTQYPVLKPHLDQVKGKYGTTASKPAAEQRQQRQVEYTEALVSNLLHPAVERVHLLMENDEDEAFIIDQIKRFRHADSYVRFIPAAHTGNNASERLWRYISECQRVHFVKLRRWLLYSDAFGYTRKQLVGRACVIQNGDISLSLDPEHIKNYQYLSNVAIDSTGKPYRQLKSALFTISGGRKKIFVLSRSHVKLPTCSKKVGCDRAASKGSYDTYIFESPLPEILEWQVPMPQNIWGAENRVIWTLKCLNISVTNPCNQLVTVHHHCESRYRPGQQEDPPNLPQVKYSSGGPYSFPTKGVAPSVWVSMASADFPMHARCHLYPWNGPDAISEETISALYPTKSGGGGGDTKPTESS